MTPAFQQQMKRMSVLRFAPPTLDAHWGALHDMSEPELTRAVSEALRECETFPTPATLRRLALATAPLIGPDEDRGVPIEQPVSYEVPHFSKPVTVTREWVYYDERCSDTGWQTVWCGANLTHRKPWVELAACQRDHEHAAHEWVRICSCASSNPAVLKRKERQAQQAARRAQRAER